MFWLVVSVPWRGISLATDLARIPLHHLQYCRVGHALCAKPPSWHHHAPKIFAWNRHQPALPLHLNPSRPVMTFLSRVSVPNTAHPGCSHSRCWPHTGTDVPDSP